MYSVVNHVKASSVLIKQAKCMMYCGQMEDALNLSLLGINQKQELGCDEEDLVYSFDDCASIYIGCGRSFDVSVG